jgi:outer membrane protein OmpA-like peptidoglycan-associated protein
MHRLAAAVLVFSALISSGCSGCWSRGDVRRYVSGSGVSGGASVEPDAPAAGGAVAGGAVGEWVDPEPADAQARAEQVVGDPINRDKITQLTMRITTLENRTSGLEGFTSGLSPANTSLDDRLTRLGAEITNMEITIRLPGSVLFDFDSAEIRPDAARTLTEVAEVIKGYAGKPVRIEGHTDSIASDAYNQKLSELRAQSVKAWLVARGSERARLSTQGFGETKPVADNNTADGRQRNRRVEVIISKGPG